MSTRKSEPASPFVAESTPTALRDVPQASVFEDHDCTQTLLEAAGVRPEIKLMFKDLQGLQGAEKHAIWPKQREKEQNRLYQKLFRVRGENKRESSP